MNRIFLACTPRAGNLWFRKMLAGMMGGKEFAAHAPHEMLWDDAEPACVVAMHWHRTPEFAEFLTRNRFETLVIVRNPLDILISILHFSQREPATARWLLGEGGDESSLAREDPASPRFLDYALSRRASSLLHVSAEWYASAQEVIRYEGLVADPEGTLDLTARSLNFKPVVTSREVVQQQSTHQMEKLPRQHFWRGEPGLWRRVIPREYLQAIYARYQDLFELWDYEKPDDQALSREQAKANWDAL